MAKVRLNGTMRDRLRRFAAEKIDCPAERAAVEAAYQKAEPLVRAAVLAKFPHKDMLVCAKYNKAAGDDCIKLRLTAGGVEQFNFTKGTGPLVTTLTYQGAIYDADTATTDAVTEWLAAADALKKAVDAKNRDYGALIGASRTLEEITDVWPEAEELRPLLAPQSRALVVLSNDVIARIKADVASRKTEA